MIARALTRCRQLIGLGQSPATTEEERRLSGRLPCDVPTTCKRIAERESAELPTRVKNVSMGGACLHLPVALAPGELLSLSLPGQISESSARVLACVIRCDALSEGAWEIGCTFASPLTAQDLRRFDSTLSEPSGDDRRGWERFPCRARAVYQIVRTPEVTASQPATIVNISGGGLALASEQALEVGDLLSVDLSYGDDHVLTALASVVRAHRDEGRQVVGCNFIRELTGAHLTRLLG